MAKGGSRGGGGKSRSRAATGTAPSNGGDLAVRPPDMRSVPKRVPSNVQGMIVWDIVKFTTTITTAVGGITETNFNVGLSSHPQSASWIALFDQWTIPQFSVSFESQMPPGLTAAPAVMYTALDFDNSTSLGSVTAIQDYSTCGSRPMTPQTSFVRSVRPCCKSALAGSSIVNAGLERLWVDSAQSGIGFFGIRSIATATATPYNISAVVTVWYAFRNQI